MLRNYIANTYYSLSKEMPNVEYVILNKVLYCLVITTTYPHYPNVNHIFIIRLYNHEEREVFNIRLPKYKGVYYA